MLSFSESPRGCSYPRFHGTVPPPQHQQCQHFSSDPPPAQTSWRNTWTLPKLLIYLHEYAIKLVKIFTTRVISATRISGPFGPLKILAPAESLQSVPFAHMLLLLTINIIITTITENVCPPLTRAEMFVPTHRVKMFVPPVWKMFVLPTPVYKNVCPPPSCVWKCLSPGDKQKRTELLTDWLTHIALYIYRI